MEILTSHYKSLNPKYLLENKKANNTFLLTFDDGLEEIYSVIFPILKAKNISAIFFITPNFVDNKVGLYKHYISFIITHLEKSDFESTTLKKIGDILTFTSDSSADFKKKIINIKYANR